MKPIFKAYKTNKTFNENWTAIYIQTKKLAEEYDPEINVTKKDISFCIHLILQIIMTIKFEPGLFSDAVDLSEWDYIVKFWGQITQRLFYFSGLRFKWGDTHLTLHDTIGDVVLKADLRTLHDNIKQRYNVESEAGVAEAAEKNPGAVKFKSNRSKVLIESKAVIDRSILDGYHIDNVDSLRNAWYGGLFC